MTEQNSTRAALYLQAFRLALTVATITGTAWGTVLVNYPADTLPPPPWEFTSNGPPVERSQHTVFVSDGVLHLIDTALITGNTLGFLQRLPLSPNQVIEVEFRARVLSGERVLDGTAPFTVSLYNGTVYADLSVGPQSVTALGSQQPGSFTPKFLVNEPVNGTDWHVYRYQLDPRGIEWWVDGTSLGHAATEMLLPNVTDDRRINMDITSAMANVELDYLILKQTPDPLTGVPVELGIFGTRTGIGSQVGSMPPGVVITYELREGSTGQGGPMLADLFESLVVFPSDQTQIFDLAPHEDPYDFQLVAQALTNGQPNVFRLATRFAVPESGSGTISGVGVEMPVPPDAPILFFRLTVAPFSIFQSATDPRFFQTTTFHVQVAAFGFPPPLPPTLALRLNQTHFRVGETLHMALDIHNPGPFLTTDVYVGVILPDGQTILWLTNTAPLEGVVTSFTQASDPRSFVPIIRGVSWPAGMRATQQDYFTHTFTGLEPLGTYHFLVGWTKPNSLEDGRIDEGDVLALAWAPFSFTRGSTPALYATMRAIQAKHGK